MRHLKIGLRTLLITGSIALAAFSTWQISTSHGGRFLIERSQSELQERLVKISMHEVDQITLEQALRSELDTEPRNWVVIDSIESIADGRSIALNETIKADLDLARSADHSLLNTATECARCAWDSSSCQLSRAMACGTAVSMTPIGDVAGIAKAGSDYLNGNEFDQIDAALSVIGLGATVMSFGTAGSSLTVKAGAGFLKFAYLTGNIPPSIVRTLRTAASQGIDWARLRTVRSVEDMKSVMRMDALRPATNAASSLGSLVNAAGIQQGLYLLRNSKNVAELQTLSRVASAWKDETAGLLRVIGKNRVLRASLRVAGDVYRLILGIIGIFLSACWATLSLLGNRLLRLVRRLVT